eukprot:9553587-Alexandrium_andersonii.AAC.3
MLRSLDGNKGVQGCTTSAADKYADVATSNDSDTIASGWTSAPPSPQQYHTRLVIHAVWMVHPHARVAMGTRTFKPREPDTTDSNDIPRQVSMTPCYRGVGNASNTRLNSNT